MSELVDAVGVRPMGDEFEAVSMRVGGRVQTVVVDRGLGAPLAKILLSAPLVRAVREAVAAYLCIGAVDVAVEDEAPFELFFGLMRAVVEQLVELDRRPLGDELAPVAVGESPGPREVRHGVNPGREIAEAANLLYTGNREGNSGESIFRSVAVAGVCLIATPEGPKARPYGTVAVDETCPDAYRPLAAQLRELAEGLDGLFVSGELARAETVVRLPPPTGPSATRTIRTYVRAMPDTGQRQRTCRVCGCTSLDCSGCIARTGAPCHWVADDLCSACVEASP